MAFCGTVMSVIGAARTIAGEIIELEAAQDRKKRLESLQESVKALAKSYSGLAAQGNVQRDRLVNWAELLKVSRDVRDAVDALQDFLPLVTPPKPGVEPPIQGVPAQVAARPLVSNLQEYVGQLRAVGTTGLQREEREIVERLRDGIRAAFDKIDSELTCGPGWRLMGDNLGDIRGFLGGIEGAAWEAFSAKATDLAPVPVH